MFCIICVMPFLVVVCIIASCCCLMPFGNGDSIVPWGGLWKVCCCVLSVCYQFDIYILYYNIICTGVVAVLLRSFYTVIKERRSCFYILLVIKVCLLIKNYPTCFMRKYTTGRAINYLDTLQYQIRLALTTIWLQCKSACYAPICYS